jgi:hypothetical protein
LERWLAQKGGSPLPLVDDIIWERSLRPRTRPATPLPPQALFVTDDWDPGDDPRIREMEEARSRLVERLIAAGSSQALAEIDSIEQLRLLASFIWLPRESAPLRRLGLRIQAPGANMPRHATLRGPGFEVEMENYRFTATTASRQAAAEARREAIATAAMSGVSAADEAPRPATPAPEPVVAVTRPLDDFDEGELDQVWATRPLEAITPSTEVSPMRAPRTPATIGMAEPERAPDTGGNGARRFWPLPGLLRRGGDARRERE